MSLHTPPLPLWYSNLNMYINHQTLPSSFDSSLSDPPPESTSLTFPSVKSELSQIVGRGSPEGLPSGISERKLEQHFMNLKYVVWIYIGPDNSFSVFIQTRNISPKGNILQSGF
jgi:hypothetical protein